MGEMKPYSDVKFRGVATTDERHGNAVCYGSYFYKVRVEEILSDPDDTLEVGKEYTFATGKVGRVTRVLRQIGMMSEHVKAGDEVEVEGAYWHRGGPMQVILKIVHPTLNDELIKEYGLEL